MTAASRLVVEQELSPNNIVARESLVLSSLLSSGALPTEPVQLDWWASAAQLKEHANSELIVSCTLRTETVCNVHVACAQC